MARLRTGLRALLIAAAVLVLAVLVLSVVFTRTDFGVEQAGRFAVDRLRSAVNGELEVGRVTSGGLLRGVTLHEVSIIDADGRPFLRADSARLAYHLRTLVGGDISFDRLVVYSPVVNIERLPGQTEWNYARVFPGDTLAPDTAAAGLIQIDDATIVDGLVIVRMPWQPERPVEVDDTARLILEAVPGGIARVLRFEDVNGRLPRILWNSPRTDGKLIRVAQLATKAYIWDAPVDVRRVEGTLTIRDSLLSFAAPRVQLPGSELSMVGRVIVDSHGNRYDIEAHGDDISFADFRWLYPRLPREGGGAMRFRMQSQEGGNMLWLARDARLRTGGTRVAGSFGVVTGDTVYFTNVDLEASPLDLDLLRSLLPGDLPLEGLLIGTVEVDGPVSALRTRGNLRYRRQDGDITTESSARWTGTIRARPPYAVAGLEAELERADLGQLAALLPELRLRGHATGHIRADGSLARGLRLDGDVALERNGVRSAVRGGGRLAVGGSRSRFDLRFDAEPLALDLLAAQFPALARLTGEARGPVTVTGTLDDLRVDADVVTPAGGVVLNGSFALGGTRPRYRAEGAVTEFRLDRVVGGLPPTTVSGRFDLVGAGDRPADLDARVALDIFAARFDGIPVHGGSVRASAANGLARLDTLDLQTMVGDLTAAGTFGLSRERTGDLRFALRADTLAPLEGYLLAPPEAPDTAFFPASRLAGTVTAEGLLRGSLEAWTLTGRGTARNAIYGDVRARRLDATVEWDPADHRVVLAGSVDSLTARGRLVPGARLEGRYAAGHGELAVEASLPGAQGIDLAGAFDRIEDGVRFALHRLAVQTGSGRWELEDTATGRAGRNGFGIEPAVLARAGDGARLEVAGVLPWSPGAADPTAAAFTARVVNVRLGEFLRLAQADAQLDGVVTGRVTVSGSALAPVMEGAAMTRGLRYRDAALDSLAADLRYRDRELAGHVAGWRGRDEIVRGEGMIPIDLALTDLAQRRLDRPMEVGLTADSVPAGLVAFLAPGFSRVGGTLHGSLVIGGSARAPRFQGELRVAAGSGFFEHSGVHYRGVNALARMQDTELAVEGTLRTQSGSGTIRGTLDLEHPRDPGFDLELLASQLDAARRRDVIAVADGRVRIRGRYSAPVVSGSVRFTEGELNLGEILRQYRIVQLEPWFYEVLDTAALAFRPPPETPFLANLRVSNATLTVARDFWLRGPELNVEVAGELAVNYDRRAEDLRMSGVLQAVRGTYELRVFQDVPGRRFEIRSGTIEFVGTPGIDPNLNIGAYYRLRRAQGEPIDVLAQLAGTLQTPRVRLTSESDLPISESDLASYILFGRSSSELSQSESDALSSSQIGGGGTFGQIGRNVSGLLAPTVYGLASSGLQWVLPVDYVGLAPTQEWQIWQPTSYLRDAQLELGAYALRDEDWGDVFLVGTVRLPRGAQTGSPLLSSVGGVRAEWRFHPTWTSEFFFEDRFARLPSFGLEEIEDRRVWGLSLFRDWGY
ncbi:MAG TPA: translocation/assembly module TamB domain-containing protein [Longimicrobiales bacterium]|nr:translocation/assembly module TamB domain-containing protein [Longimicrobiales bacterium]